MRQLTCGQCRRVFVVVRTDASDDVEARTVGVNRRGSDDPERGVPIDAFLAELDAELAPHR